MEPETDDTGTDNTPSKEEAAQENTEPEQDKQPSEASDDKETTDDTTQVPVEGTIKALYGVEPVPSELDK